LLSDLLSVFAGAAGVEAVELEGDSDLLLESVL
jgi:hypothetical protein